MILTAVEPDAARYFAGTSWVDRDDDIDVLLDGNQYPGVLAMLGPAGEHRSR